MWIVYALGAIASVAISDLFRKLSSNLNDAFFSNLLFQAGGFFMGIILYLLFSRKVEPNPKGVMFALIGGLLISIFTSLTFKALAAGPGISTVIPVIRVGGVLLVAILGVLLFRDRLTWQLILGIILACSGIYLIFSV